MSDAQPGHSRKFGARRAIATAAVLGAAAVTLVGLSSPAQAAGSRGAGYVWANQASAPSYTPSSTYQWNSTNAQNTITRSGLGTYTIRYPGLGITGGTVHVTSYGASSDRCKVQSWGPSGNDQQVNIRCFTLSGAPTDSMFTATYTNVTRVASGRKLGYVWAGSPTASAYTPSTTYQGNSTGATNTVTRTTAGTYSVTMPGLSGARGDVQVTAYGTGSEYCKVTGWGPSGTNQNIGVKCFTTAGAPADAMFTMTYVDRSNILGVGVCCTPDGNPSAYAWANQPSAASYAPSSTYQFAGFDGNQGTITRSAVGTYG
ncbi:MAG: hypothetical protein H0T78_00845, partial [Longispora sp.]|nr:hypothetical protein [Longispora sp. (in: high G+C Gram-positive bacteria)]